MLQIDYAKLYLKSENDNYMGRCLIKVQASKQHRTPMNKKRAPHFVFVIICRILQLQDTHQQE